MTDTSSTSDYKYAKHLDIHDLRLARYPKFLRLLILLAFTLRIILSYKPQVVFYHMVDLHAAILSPIFKVLGIRQVLWYAHAHKSWQLIFAMRFVDRILTSTKGSFPNISAKDQERLLVIGQGIAEDEFPLMWKMRKTFLQAVSVGRIDPSKEISLILRTLRQFSSKEHAFEITLFGSPSNSKSLEYLKKLLVENSQIGDSLKIHTPGSIARNAIKEALPHFDFFVHAFRGSLDKSLLEATLIGIPVVTQNQEFINEFGSWSGILQPDFQTELWAFLQSDLSTIQDRCEKNRALCIENHSFEKWIDKLSNILQAA